MIRAGRLARALPIGLGVVAAIVILTWALEHAMPPPYSGYLAVVLVGLVGTEVYKRQPRQRASRMLRIYLHARSRGADEADARGRLVSRLIRDEERRRRLASDLGAAWVAPSEKERVLAGVALLLGREGKTLGPDVLGSEYDRVRDQFTIPGWEALPREFMNALHGRLDERERDQLDALVARYRLFEQKFFRNASSLAANPEASTLDFARLLHSMGNRLAKEQPGDAERAYRLSLRLRPERNLAHAGLALLLADTGRTREAAREAQTAIEVLDEYQRRAADEAPTTEDISPFRSPQSLRDALARLVQEP